MTPDTSDMSSLVLWIIVTLCGTIAVMAGAIRFLFKQIMDQQRQVEGLLSETKEVLGSVAELVRITNAQLKEVETVMSRCRDKADA